MGRWGGGFAVKVRVMDVYFEAAHYTGFSDEYNYLHGHTYKIDVEYEAELGGGDYLMDFEAINSVVQGVARRWNYKLLVPEGDVGRIEIRAPFKVEIKPVRGGRYATAEVICRQLLEEVRGGGIGRSDGRLSLTVWEGGPRYAAQCSE